MTNDPTGNSTEEVATPPRWRPAPKRRHFADTALHIVLLMIDGIPAENVSILMRKIIVRELERDGFDSEETRRRFLRMLSAVKKDHAEKTLRRKQAAEKLANGEQE